MNAAQQIHRALGVATHADDGANQRTAHYTKSGPGRRHNNKPALQTIKQKNAGAYGRGLRNWITRTQVLQGAGIHRHEHPHR